MEIKLSWFDPLPEKVLEDRFGIVSGFRTDQRAIIESLVNGKRILAIQRTGWGKSLCYQMASLYYPHLTLIFSPLKALMRDQCQRCNERYALPAAIVSSDFSEEDNQVTLEQAVAGKFKLLFIAPERLSNTLWQRYVPNMQISMIVIDEAHCISTWGHDFRPHYRRIVKLLDAIPQDIPVLALTATANKHVEKDILEQMGADVLVRRGTMQRPNLYLQVVSIHGDVEKLSYLGEVLPHSPGTGIIYTATQKDAEAVATFLNTQGIAAQYYHGGREADIRQEIERDLMANRYKVICSTNALGMGIDKQDIRFIIHYQIPASPIHYYQEVGRAGRDGNIAWCILLYDADDLTIQRYFIDNAKPASKCYERVLVLIRENGQGLREIDLLRKTGYAQTMLRTILADLEDQHFVERNSRSRIYTTIHYVGQMDFADYDLVRKQKLQELDGIQRYAQGGGCYMEYLTTYLGDQAGHFCGVCGQCRPINFPLVNLSRRMLDRAEHFLELELLPRIERRGTVKAPCHGAGWSLSYHGMTRVGKLVRASKYEDAGLFPTALVERAAEVIQTRYPIEEINGIVSVPPTSSGVLVESFARQVAALLGIQYVSTIMKVRTTEEQKHCTNRQQKEDNVKGAFIVQAPELIADRTLLLIDDIYDSGQMMREVGRVLLQAGARVVYPFTITRTRHADDR